MLDIIKKMVCLGTYDECGSSMFIYCMVSYHVIAAPYVRSVGHVFAYLDTLDDDSERSIDYETSLLPKVFSFCPKHAKCHICERHRCLVKYGDSTVMDIRFLWQHFIGFSGDSTCFYDQVSYAII